MPRSPHSPVTYGTVLRDRRFLGLFVAQVLSLVADRLAAVALTALVFARTGSPLLAATTYAATLLPWLVSGLLLSGIADRHPRRTVMIVTDLGRAALVGLMTLPHVPLAALLVLLVLSGLLAPTFEAARAAALPLLLGEEEYVRASALSLVAGQVSQLVGLAVAGVVVAQAGVRFALGLDAGSFLLSALVVAAVLRPGDGGSGTGRSGAPASSWAQTRAGLALVFGDPVLRPLLVMAWFVACVLVAPEGLAVALLAETGRSTTWLGVLMAAIPCGMAVGAALVGRWAPVRRTRSMLPLAGLAAVPLLLTPLAERSLPALTALWVIAGVGGAYQVPANALFMRRVPDAFRARAFGIAQSGMLALQGVVLLAAGAAAEVLGASRAIAALTALLLPVLWLLGRRWPVDLLAGGKLAPAPDTRDAVLDQARPAR